MGKSDYLSSIWKTPISMWVLFGVTALLVAYTFHGAIQDMIHVWGNKEEYGYAYLIPFITIFLIWQRKDKLAEIEFIPSLLGVALVVVGVFLLLVGTLAASRTLPQYSLIITVLGVVYALLGWKAFKLVMVPLALLFFIVPLPLFIFQALSGKLQLISSQIGVEVIRWFGISVYLEGNVIDLGSYKLQVVEACSGLRYLFPLISLSFIAAYLYKAEFWKRAIIVISSIPITVFMNSFRIGVIGVLVEYGGPEQAEGFLHDFEGWIVFMACIAILVLEMAVLARIGPRKQTLAQTFAIDFPEPIPDDAKRELREVKPITWFVPAIVAVVAVSNAVLQTREHIVPERRVFAEFPLEIQEWKGTTGRLEENILGILKAEDYIISDYVDDDDRLVNFYVAYYPDQVSGGAIHSPRGCIPGGGWKIKDLSLRTIEEIKVNGEPIEVNRLIIKRGEYTQIVYYWFQGHGRIVTSEWAAKWFLFWDSLTRSRTDGALVRLTAFVRPGEDSHDVDQRLVNFTESVYPHLADYIPD